MIKDMKPIVIATVGTGYGGYLHANGYKNVTGIPIRLKTICGQNLAKAEAFKERYGYEQVCNDFDEILADPEIDVIDLGVPPTLHIPFSIKALKAGKHIICEKPLSGYFGKPGETEIGRTVPKAKMWEEMEKQLAELKSVIDESGKKFMYAENFIYSTPVQKAAEIIRAKKSKIVMMNGEELIIGSTSPLAGQWKNFGGGTTMRNGIHILSSMIYLKKVEAEARGEEFKIVSVTAENAQQSKALSEEEHGYIQARPDDVEDMTCIIVTFHDGTKAVVVASDATLGGSQNHIDVYTNDSTLRCTLTQTNLLEAYTADDKGLENVEWGELVKNKTGWNNVYVSDPIIRGYMGEMQEFLSAIAENREAETGFDIAYEIIRVVYASFRSAEEGRRINL
ncbi:MAG: Gfo/Idh/MocA family oxidoreductase [Lachnospiraceae bacterium]|nr:Gfo/Idh/MocA family oxidoreductase [Candidatus Minthocola equi]